MKTRAQDEIEAKFAIDRWAAEAGWTGWVPGSAFFLVAADGDAVTTEWLRNIPFVGWAIKDTGTKSELARDVVIGYFRERSPLPV